jgi:DNA-binding transcriptional MerR regulator
MNPLLKIGDVAAETGLTVDAIRFYEREHLLRTAARSSGRFRLFSKSDVDDLAFIRNAQKLGFSLQEVRELMVLKGALRPDCKQVEQLLEHKISAVREKITALRSLERDLQRAKAHCESNLSNQSRDKISNCPVLSDISRTRGGKKR